MDPSTAQHQEMPNNPSSLENMLVCSTKPQQQQDRKPRPQPEQALKCPRCDSTNTKFCYYNNYSLSQPRYFCKSCRRYWTKGGTLRNVPVGGGCRKNKRSSSSSSKNKSQDQSLVVPSSGHPLAASLPHLSYDTNDLSLAFARLQKQSVGFDQDHHEFAMLGSDVLGNPSITSTAGAAPAAFLDALRSNFLGTQNGNFVHHGFHNYGFGSNGSLGEVEHGIGIGIGIGVGVGDHQQQEQIGLPAFEDQLTSTVASTAAVSVTTMKQEISENRDSRVLWGFPWQLSHGDHNHHGPSMSDLDTARESWNNSTNFTSAWHGLLNSPLM